MKKQRLKILNILLFISFLFIFIFSFFIKKDMQFSKDEKRILMQKPFFNKESIISGTYTNDLEKYILDQFPLRQKFREIKSYSSYYLFQKLQNENIIVNNNIMIKLNLNYKYDNVITTIKRIEVLKNNYFGKNNCYFVLIPDKNCYNLFKNNIIQNNLNVNYDKIINDINKNTTNIKVLNIKDKLNLSNYYETDSHWKNNDLISLSSYILSKMGNNIIMDRKHFYKEKEIENFKGVLASQGALNKKEKIVYLTNEIIENAKVYNYETEKETKVYDLDKLTDKKSLDMYDIFLSGASSLLKIQNNNNSNNKTLVIFRDSFASSISPLFVEYYNIIYLVDLRYIDSTYLDKYIKFDGTEDVLFMYSTALMETPNNFKIH